MKAHPLPVVKPDADCRCGLQATHPRPCTCSFCPAQATLRVVFSGATTEYTTCPSCTRETVDRGFGIVVKGVA